MKLKIIRKGIIGRRIIKTAIAIFITSFICLALGLPAIFAVITAIVTVEPTTHDSIRKGMERFPASAIGAGLAAGSVYLFGESPLSYTLAGALTIIFCQKLKLHSGTLVAALTAVAMIPDLHGDLFYSFLIRLGTTSIGLLVSTSVNVLILPADYLSKIKKRHKNHIKNMKYILSGTLEEIINNKEHIRQCTFDANPYDLLKRELSHTQQLIEYQRKELKYHRFKITKYRELVSLKKTADYLQRAGLHLGNLHFLPKTMKLSDYERRLIKLTRAEFSHMLSHMDEPLKDDYIRLIDELNNHLRYEFSISRPVKKYNYEHQLSEKIILFYELIALQDLFEDLHHHLLHTQDKKYNPAD
ncbi:FUSC family protein [Salipaludibacillus aurantiacus]|uniref:Uncharacterized membrane protein YgaE, UPF0421/DUF939 family n=1 Tax=Salipaludibacillus aurantiacus TaxID=1601833 RepID=A0A1H9VTW6_9BACI|nr:aromatic acid exporter family protein [Salipaludibacillus aurantiacus]SES25032.1 Uncharacterized membrane protein YgaE, UPF0421/DUF939 family [Salipaludibacillus aurantiacus]